MIKIEAAQRLNASYSGTKSKDLMAYIRSLVPGIKNLAQGGGAPGESKTVYRPSFRSGYISLEDASALAHKLVADGWVGEKLKDKKTGKLYIIYKPTVRADQTGTSKDMYIPYICLYKPGEGRCRMILEHCTSAAARESRFLRKLNEKRPSMDYSTTHGYLGGRVPKRSKGGGGY